MPCLPSAPALALVITATLVAAHNWIATFVNLALLWRRHHEFLPIIYLASAALTAGALLLDPRPACVWIILVPLADLSNHSLPWIAGDWVWRTLRRARTRKAA